MTFNDRALGGSRRDRQGVDHYSRKYSSIVKLLERLSEPSGQQTGTRKAHLLVLTCYAHYITVCSLDGTRKDLGGALKYVRKADYDALVL